MAEEIRPPDDEYGIIDPGPEPPRLTIVRIGVPCVELRLCPDDKEKEGGGGRDVELVCSEEERGRL